MLVVRPMADVKASAHTKAACPASCCFHACNHMLLQPVYCVHISLSIEACDILMPRATPAANCFLCTGYSILHTLYWILQMAGLRARQELNRPRRHQQSSRHHKPARTAKQHNAGLTPKSWLPHLLRSSVAQQVRGLAAAAAGRLWCPSRLDRSGIVGHPCAADLPREGLRYLTNALLVGCCSCWLACGYTLSVTLGLKG